jgi:hypothetical protein
MEPAHRMGVSLMSMFVWVNSKLSPEVNSGAGCALVRGLVR